MKLMEEIFIINQLIKWYGEVRKILTGKGNDYRN